MEGSPNGTVILTFSFTHMLRPFLNPKPEPPNRTFDGHRPRHLQVPPGPSRILEIWFQNAEKIRYAVCSDKLHLYYGLEHFTPRSGSS